MALREIAVRVGPATGAIWQLQTPGLRYEEGIAIFSVTFPSGLEETLLFEMVDEGGWRLRAIHTLVDPVEPMAGRLLSRSMDAGHLDRLVPVGSPRALALLALLGMLTFGLRGRREANNRRPVLAGVLTAMILGCGTETSQPTQGKSADGPAPANVLQLGALLDLRLDLATDAAASAASVAIVEGLSGLARDAATLWLAQAQLHRGNLPETATSLATVMDPSPLPLAALLRARLAFLHVDQDKTFQQYTVAVQQGPEHDGLQLEIGDAHTLMGLSDQAEIIFKLLARMGSRLGEIYYWLATVAVINDEVEAGQDLVRTGWSLRPIPRSVLFSNPLLATLAARPSLLGLFDLHQPTEPTVPRRAVARSGTEPLALPSTAHATLMGDLLTVVLDTNRLVVPGGGVLAPSETPTVDAGTAMAAQEEEALSRLETLATEVQNTGVSGLLRRETETCATALARRERWEELEALTRGIDDNVERVRPILAQLRARSLQELGRNEASRDLLIALARSDIANNRRDPGTLFQLADTMAEAGDYELAIKLVEKARRIAPRQQGDRRLRLFQMEKQLADDPKRFATDHFDLVYPRATGDRYPKQVGLVLEAERERLGRWIPIPRAHRIEVQLFPVESFLRAYSSSVAVVGIFDGRVRVPLADLRSLHPQLVSILSHEVAHAMIAGATNDNAPRWLHEGLAQHIEMTSSSINPYPDLHATGRTLSLPVIDAILAGFGEAQFVDLAYSEAAWLVHGIEARFGVDGIHRLLAAFKRGPDTEQAIQRAFGQTMAAFEAKLVDWAVHQAPATWPAQLRRYDHELEENLIRRASTTDRSLPKLGTTGKEARRDQKARRAKTMQEWHRSYARATAPVKSALGPVISAFRGERQPVGFSTTTCERLRDALRQARSDPSAFSPPDRKLTATLETAYSSLETMAQACLQGRDAQVRSALTAAEKHLGQAARTLQPFGLRP